MTAGFCIKSSLIVRNYSQLESPADSVQLTSREKPIVPGSSIRGAMRARAERIVRALGARHLQITKTLFGYAETDSNDKRKGKLRIEESALKECDKQIQCRTKIDRFTGGTIDGALFNSEAMWSQSPTDENLTLKLSCRSCVEAEAGLILLLLKDLWTGDLPLGGEKAIGRGVLQGLYAELNYAGQTVKLAQTAEGKLQISEAGLLEKWVTALVEECGKGDAYNA